jgi:hypothetical protein
MARRQIFDSIQAKRHFTIQRWIVRSLFVGVLAGIFYFFYSKGLVYDYHTEYFLRDLKTGFQYSRWGLVWDAVIGILWRWDVLFLVLSVAGASAVFLRFYRNIARKFVFFCSKCRQAIRLRDAWVCGWCGANNFQTIRYNLFTTCQTPPHGGGCHAAQRSYQCANPRCAEVLPLKEGADLQQNFAKKYGAEPPMRMVAPANIEVLNPVPTQELTVRDRSFFNYFKGAFY